jgi:transmembrane sensor
MEQLSKYIDNKNFILWVFEPNEELETWWNQFTTDYPEEKRNILLARRVLQTFRTTEKKLTEEEKILLFYRVLKQVEEKHRVGSSRQFITSFLKYAAVAILFFGIGALLFYKKNQFNPEFYTQKLAEPVPDNSAKLIRANGDNILLKEDNSVLQYQPDGKLVVNKDTINADRSKNAKAAAMNQLIIPYGKTSNVLLSDGTKVYLNAGSRLVYPENFNGKTREVFLVGEAFFEVKADQDHPFVVQLNDLRLKVLGTRFNVSAYLTDNVVETVLAEGKVCLEQNRSRLFERTTELAPNQLASFDRTTKETNIKTVNTDFYILWKEGIMKFESTDLSRIIKKLERYYNIRYHFDDPLLGGLRFSGKLELKEDKNEINERVARAASVKIYKMKEGLYEIIK